MSLKSVFLAILIYAVAVRCFAGDWSVETTHDLTYNISKQWTNRDDNKGRFMKWALENGECGVQVQMWPDAFDADATQNLVTIANQWRKEWTWSGAGGGNHEDYTFSFNLKGYSYAKADLDVQYRVGYGLVSAKGQAKLTGDTGRTDSKIDDKEVAVGAEVQITRGGLTGFGIGAEGVSLTWTLPDNGNYHPSIVKDAYPSVADNIQDPSTSAFVQLDSSASASAQMVSGASGGPSDPSVDAVGLGRPYSPWTATMRCG